MSRRIVRNYMYIFYVEFEADAGGNLILSRVGCEEEKEREVEREVWRKNERNGGNSK